MDAMGQSGADVARELLSQGERLDVDGYAALLESCDMLGQLVAHVLNGEGHAIDFEGTRALVAQEAYSAALDGARAAVCGVIAG